MKTLTALTLSNTIESHTKEGNYMAEYIARRNANLPPLHPGQLLKETVLPALKMSKTELAIKLHISRNHLYGILAGKQPVTPPTAVRLGKLCGNGAKIWVNMQAAVDLWEAERETDVSDLEVA
jgi:addiction module HigA family antidote